MASKKPKKPTDQRLSELIRQTETLWTRSQKRIQTALADNPKQSLKLVLDVTLNEAKIPKTVATRLRFVECDSEGLDEEKADVKRTISYSIVGEIDDKVQPALPGLQKKAPKSRLFDTPKIVKADKPKRVRPSRAKKKAPIITIPGTEETETKAAQA